MYFYLFIWLKCRFFYYFRANINMKHFCHFWIIFFILLHDEALKRFEFLISMKAYLVFNLKKMFSWITFFLEIYMSISTNIFRKNPGQDDIDAVFHIFEFCLCMADQILQTILHKKHGFICFSLKNIVSAGTIGKIIF